MAQISEPPAIDYRDPRPFHPTGTAGRILQLATEAAEQGRPIVIREICRQLSLTPGAPYSHFANSAHLESVVAYNGLLTMASAITTTTPSSGDSRDRLLATCRAYRGWALANRPMFGFIFPTAGRPHDTPFARHVILASQAIAVPASKALRDGWDSGRFTPPTPGPPAHPLEIPDVVSLNSDESRVANSLWINVHGAVVIELAMGTHDGWDPVDPMFDWLISAQLSAHLGSHGPR
ncbi:MAG: hypothetical protein RLZ19_1117 [Actinomycetota bacterium]